MKNSKSHFKLIGLALAFIAIAGTMIIAQACSRQTSETVTDTKFTELFYRTGDEFTGGDGTYSVLLPDGRTAWIFGDTFIGDVKPGATIRIRQDPMYIRNSIVVQEGEQLTTLHQKHDGNIASFAIHPDSWQSDGTLSEDSVWFWPGDAFIENGMMKLFLSEFIQVDTGMWDFEWKGTWLASYDLPEITEKELIPMPQGTNSRVHLGHAVLVNGAYTYVYGAGNGKPHVARYPYGNPRTNWEYYNGNSWSNSPEEIAPMTDIQGSEQFTVMELNGKYVLITQMGGFSTEICSFISETPYGPWKNRQLLYETPLPDTTTNLFTYNAVAHPQFNKDGQLLISYNMNSHVLQDHFDNPGIYRPRFIRVPMEKIFAETNGS